MNLDNNIRNIKEIVFRESKIAKEINSLWLIYLRNAEKEEERMVKTQIEDLKELLKKTNDQLLDALEGTGVQRPLKQERKIAEVKEKGVYVSGGKTKEIAVKQPIVKQEKEKMSLMDEEILRRIKKVSKKKAEEKQKKPSEYVKIANNLFGKYVRSFIKQKELATLEKDLIKSNLNYTSISYFSALILTTLIAVVAAVFIIFFFLFFNISPDFPIITPSTEAFFSRLIKVFWLIILAPGATLIFMYVYPSLERKTLETRIDLELPFATIHMAAISGSLIEPIKVFSIISSTKEYPNLEREFNKLLNEINIYGYDLVTALKNLAANSPSAKLSELFNGLATTITSGGDLYDFFDKRSQTLLFEYRLDKEKRTKAAETFMDIYISVVIAAPMILMLLLMMMKVSGIGTSLSTSTITLMIVGGVCVINIFFLVFLQLKQPETA